MYILWKKLISHKMITLHTRAVRTTNLWLLAPSTKATKLQLTFAPPLSALKLCHCAALCDEAIWRVFRPPFHPPPQKIRAIIQKRTVCYCTLARTLWTNKSFRYVHCSGLFVFLFVCLLLLCTVIRGDLTRFLTAVSSTTYLRKSVLSYRSGLCVTTH